MIQMARLGFGVLLLVSSSVCAAEARSSRAAESGTLDRDRSAVREAQAELHLLNLYDGRIGGGMGRKTRKAFATYQQMVGLEATGSLDQRTYFALKNPGKVKVCMDEQVPMADCLDAAASLDAFLDKPPTRTAPDGADTAEGAMTAPATDDAEAGSTTEPSAAAAPCDDPKLPVKGCLDAVSQMEGFMKNRGVLKR